MDAPYMNLLIVFNAVNGCSSVHLFILLEFILHILQSYYVYCTVCNNKRLRHIISLMI